MFQRLPHVLLEKVRNETPDCTRRTELTHIVAANLKVEILELGVLDAGGFILGYEIACSPRELTGLKVDQRS